VLRGKCFLSIVRARTHFFGDELRLLNMKLAHRRQFIRLAAATIAAPAIARFAKADTYPTRPVRLIVGFPAGGTADIAARLMGQRLSERLGQPFVIENRPGANTNLAAEAVVRAPADGYTLLLTGPSNAINATIYDKLSYNFIRDIVMFAGITRTPLVLEVNPALQVNSFTELIAHSKANPGKISLASYGTGSISHLAGELLKMTTGVKMVHVPYRGSAPLLPDLLGGQVQAAFDNLPTSIEHIRASRLRALAVTTAQRSHALPDVPTVAEFLPGYEASAWTAVGVPKNTPAEIIEKLNNEINASLDAPEIKGRLADLGATTFAGSIADFGQFIADETEKWGKVIRTANIKLD
jgi:tripartite-type tricarboxylate transporter receptor subunit TctC